MRFPLRYQVFLPMAGLIVVTLIATSLVTAAIQGGRTKREIDEELDRLARILAKSAFPLTQPILDQLHGLSGADFVLREENGVSIAAGLASVDRINSVTRTLAAHPAPMGKPAAATIDGRPFVYRTVKLARRGERGEQLLHILYPESLWSEAWWEAIYPPLVTGGVGILVAGLISLALARRVTRPIASLSEQMERLARSEYEALPLPARRDEIRELISAGNTLAGRLRDLNQAIRRSERFAVLGRLGGGLAHQLRNGVTGARLAVQLHGRVCAEDRESIGVALRQLELVEEQLLSFLAIGKPGVARKEPCDLASLIDEVVPLVAATCRHRGIALERRAGASVDLVADRDQLRQLLINLALNAIEACERGGQVTLDLAQTGEHIRLAVCDTGRGPAADVAETLFDPFVTTKPEGIGLGLAVARQIAETHGGVLRYRRLENQTCFELLLPGMMEPHSGEFERCNIDGEASQYV